MNKIYAFKFLKSIWLLSNARVKHSIYTYVYTYRVTALSAGPFEYIKHIEIDIC